MITLFAPDGIGEVGPGTDLAAEIALPSPGAALAVPAPTVITSSASGTACRRTQYS